MARCAVCEAGKPRDVIAETPTVWVTAGTTAPLPGYVCVVSRQHAVEPSELDESVTCDFWLDCLRAARAIQEVVDARKINYEIHGNTIPHLHMHVYPRYDGDPFEGVPIDGSSKHFRRSGEDLDRLRFALQAAM